MWTMEKISKKNTWNVNIRRARRISNLHLFFYFRPFVVYFQIPKTPFFFPTIELKPNKETSFLDILQLYLCQFYRTSFLKEIIRDERL